MTNEVVDPRLAALALAPAARHPMPDPPPPPAPEPAVDLGELQAAADLVIDLEALSSEPPAVIASPPPSVGPSLAVAVEAAPEIVAPAWQPAGTLPESAVLYRAAVLMGLRPRRADLTLEELGLRIRGARETAIPWAEITDIAERRGEVVIRSRGDAVRFALVVHGVAEPTFAAPFVRVLEEARAGTLDLRSSAFHDLANTIDALPDRFHETEDPTVLGLLAGSMGLLTLTFALLLPDMLRILTQVQVATGGFLIGSKLSPLDPRILFAAVGAAGLLVAAAARIALGAQATAWSRGALRGWQRGLSAVRAFSRALGAFVLMPALGAAMVLAGVVLAIPSARVQTVVDAAGIQRLREIPLFDQRRTWGEVTHIVEIPGRAEARPDDDGVAVVIHFVDGSPLNTYDLTIRNGSDRQLYDLARQWRELATQPASR